MLLNYQVAVALSFALCLTMHPAVHHFTTMTSRCVFYAFSKFRQDSESFFSKLLFALYRERNTNHSSKTNMKQANNLHTPLFNV